jgi:hypothetical protein
MPPLGKLHGTMTYENRERTQLDHRTLCPFRSKFFKFFSQEGVYLY